jgi:hypothetical protein
MKIIFLLTTLTILLMLSACVPCEPCTPTTHKINSIYKVEKDGNFTFTITVPVCTPNRTTMCSALDNETGRCALIIR